MHLKFKSKINILGLCFIIYIKHQRFHVSIIILKAFLFTVFSFQFITRTFAIYL